MLRGVNVVLGAASGVSIDPKKVEAVWQWLVPTTIKQLREFLILTRYYRRFVKNYGRIAQPLTVLCNLSKTLKWSLETDKPFKELKEAMTNTSVLALLDFS